MQINKDRTKQYYETFVPCSCVDCRLYYKKIREQQPEICNYLETLCIDPNKPFELVSYSKGNEIIYYDCMYIVFGKIEIEYKNVINDIEIKAKTKNHPRTDIEEPHFILSFGPIKLDYPYRFRFYRHLLRDEKIKIIKKVIDASDPIGLLQAGCPEDEYLIEARLIERILTSRKHNFGLSKEIQGVFRKQFDIELSKVLVSRMRNEIVSAISWAEFEKEFNEPEELKGKIKFEEYSISMKIHDGFTVTTKDRMTFINEKTFYDIDEQDLIDSYIDFQTNEEDVYIQYRRRRLRVPFTQPYYYFRIVEKDKFELEKEKRKKGVEMIFDNKEILYDGRKK